MIGALLYIGMFLAACATALPLGFALFGRRHAAGWITGALFGYGLTAMVLWGVVQAGIPSAPAFIVAEVILAALCWGLLRRAGPWIDLPPWRRRDSLALLVVLLAVPLLQVRPFTRIGELDGTGARRYRAYFTADFLWHVALTSELSKFNSPPRNPYLARRPLHYYWSYFVLPAVIVGTAPVMHDIQSHLLVNAACAGLLFVASIFVTAWCIVPRAGPTAAAVGCVLLAASAEGSYALWYVSSTGRPLAFLRSLNIDAITAWWFNTLTIDSLPRSLWYTPQHAMACALALIAMIIVTRAAPLRPGTALLAGSALALALAFSPFLGGSFSVIFGLSGTWRALRARQIRPVLIHGLAIIPVAVVGAWCVATGTFEGARGAVAIGFSSRAAAAPWSLAALALGPVLALSLIAFGLRTWRRWPLATPIIGVVTGFFLLFFVTLTLEPVWVGWRAGQIILVLMPPIIASGFAALVDGGRRHFAVAAAVIALALGLPTTVIDAWNAQDVSNTDEAAEFRWTVVMSADSQAAAEWVRNHTPPQAIVQMSIAPRRRESWTLVPTFAERRMAAGRPISLLHSPEYDELSDLADQIFSVADPAEAARIAHSLRIDYLFVDEVERGAFETAALAKFDESPAFSLAFRHGTAAVYAVN